MSEEEFNDMVRESTDDYEEVQPTLTVDIMDEENSYR